MHRKLLLLIFLFSLSSLNAQIYNENNSLMRKALVLYQKDAKGFYQKTENVSLPVVNNISESYAYDKKAQELYVQTANGNYVITVDKDNARIYKKSKSIPHLKGDELTAAITKINQSLASKFERLNIERQRYIDDSIRIAKEDSIRRAKEDSIRRKKAEQYRQAHRWLDVPTKGISLKCAFCDERTYNDSIFCVRATTDSIFWATKREVKLGYEVDVLHGTKIPDELMRSDKYRYHYEIFKDSLNKGISCDTGFDYSKETVDEFNDLSLRGGIRKIVSEAPYGFVDEWHWDCEYGSVSFDITYTNMNKKTIRYLDVYWTITNDVGDVRKTGHFKGTGPVEPGDSAKWEWDYSSYYVAGDASNMQLTKLIITYMDGSKKVLSKNQIVCN